LRFFGDVLCSLGVAFLAHALRWAGLDAG
jgi:hypothetical protein